MSFCKRLAGACLTIALLAGCSLSNEAYHPSEAAMGTGAPGGPFSDLIGIDKDFDLDDNPSFDRDDGLLGWE